MSMSTPTCRTCGDEIVPAARAALKATCLACGERNAVEDRKSWCILTMHKQGAMLFTPAFAREAAIGINNKGGLVK
jgi:predicted RNA-binding Zn-ribbon protein involved in translation (DUF1610 family)